MQNVPENLGSTFYRDLLNAQARSFYESMEQQILRKNYSGRVSVRIASIHAARKDYAEAYRALRDDHPEYFFLGTQVQLQIRGREGIIQYQVLYPPSQIARIQLLLRLYLARITSGTERRTMLQKERMIYERIAKKLTYVDRGDASDHNVVGPLLESQGVCEGYNALLMLSLRYMGIPCIKVTGKSNRGENHCWCMVWIQQAGMGTRLVPAHCDVTWERPEQGICGFDYFNLSDKQIFKTHKELDNRCLPKCTVEHLNYYRMLP